MGETIGELTWEVALPPRLAFCGTRRRLEACQAPRAGMLYAAWLCGMLCRRRAGACVCPSVLQPGSLGSLYSERYSLSSRRGVRPVSRDLFQVAPRSEPAYVLEGDVPVSKLSLERASPL